MVINREQEKKHLFSLIRTKKLRLSYFLGLLPLMVFLPLSVNASQAALLVSLGMPDQTLKSYLVQAKNIGIPVVIRGLYTKKEHRAQAGVVGSFKDTVERVKGLISDNGKKSLSGNQKRIKGLGVSIDPTLFRSFQVGVVPALVVYDSKSDPCMKHVDQPSYTPCFSDRYDIAYGNTPIKKMLTRIADQSQSDDRSHYALSLLQAQEVHS